MVKAPVTGRSSPQAEPAGGTLLSPALDLLHVILDFQPPELSDVTLLCMSRLAVALCGRGLSYDEDNMTRDVWVKATRSLSHSHSS